MENPERGEASFSAGDKTYITALQHNEWCAIERKEKLPAGQIISEFMQFSNPEKISFWMTRIMLWGCLQRHYKAEFPEPEDVGLLIDSIGMEAAMEAISGALAAGQPKPAKGGSSPNPQQQKRRT
jgi:hypothetical protein